MAKYAKGKKSYAISDRGGQRVRYTQLKTTWDGLRVAPDEWEPKHPQLTPAKNVIDAQQLFQPRSTGQDREDVVIYIGYSYDPFLPVQERPPVGCPGHGESGLIDRIDFESYPEVTGVAGTAAVGTETPEMSITETGVAGTGGVGTELGFLEVTGTSGTAGAGSVGIEALNLSIDEAGVAGTGAVGTEALEMSINEAGVAGTGGVGDATNIDIENNLAWGQGTWGSGTWGN
tara:strand:+ start:243 stop:935 length:693 start_codon:yes stop_codon:yes gene_type:complete